MCLAAGKRGAFHPSKWLQHKRYAQTENQKDAYLLVVALILNGGIDPVRGGADLVLRAVDLRHGIGHVGCPWALRTNPALVERL